MTCAFLLSSVFRDDLDRRLQAEELANILRNLWVVCILALVGFGYQEFLFSENPAVFLGYVTSAPGSRDYMKLITEGGVKVQALEQTNPHK